MANQSINIKPHPEKGFILRAELVLRRPLEEVFDFFSRAENLEAITPDFLQFRIASPLPIEMKTGALIDYRLKLHGVPIKWRTEIAFWEPPFRFVDQQLWGPYKRWHHEHTFKAIDGITTLATDEVHYIPRFGSLVHKWFVKPDLLKIFGYRQERLAELLGGSIRPQAAPVRTPQLSSS